MREISCGTSKGAKELLGDSKGDILEDGGRVQRKKCETVREQATTKRGARRALITVAGKKKEEVEKVEAGTQSYVIVVFAR